MCGVCGRACGCAAVRLCGCAAVRLCGCAAVRGVRGLRGVRGVRVCGLAGVFQASTAPSVAPPHPARVWDRSRWRATHCSYCCLPLVRVHRVWLRAAGAAGAGIPGDPLRGGSRGAVCGGGGVPVLPGPTGGHRRRSSPAAPPPQDTVMPSRLPGARSRRGLSPWIAHGCECWWTCFGYCGPRKSETFTIRARPSSSGYDARFGCERSGVRIALAASTVAPR